MSLFYLRDVRCHVLFPRYQRLRSTVAARRRHRAILAANARAPMRYSPWREAYEEYAMFSSACVIDGALENIAIILFHPITVYHARYAMNDACHEASQIISARYT